MGTVLRVLGILIVLILVAGVIRRATGSDNQSVRKIVQVAGHTVTIPTDTPRNVFAVTRALLEQTGYRPWYRHCIIGQAERLLTHREAAKLAELPERQRNQAGLEVMLKAVPQCTQPGRQVVDPNATAEQLALIRAQTARALEQILVQEKTGTPAFRKCAASQVNGATDSQTLQLANGSEATQEALFVRLFKPCHL